MYIFDVHYIAGVVHLLQLVLYWKDSWSGELVVHVSYS